MKRNLTGMLFLMFLFTFGLPNYAHARGGYVELIGSLLISIIIMIVVFLLCREIVCWYWKINERIALLTEIRNLLSDLSEEQGTKAPSLPKSKSSTPQSEKSWEENALDTKSVQSNPGVKCYFCKREFPEDKVKRFNDQPVCHKCWDENNLSL